MTSVTSCGFHLRGKANAPRISKKIAIEQIDRSSKLMAAVIRTFRSNHVNMVSRLKDADIILNLSNEHFTEHYRGTNNNAQTTLYRLAYSIDVSAHTNKGKPLLASQKAISFRHLSVNKNAILAADYERETLKHEIQDEISYKVYQLLVSLA